LGSSTSSAGIGRCGSEALQEECRSVPSDVPISPSVLTTFPPASTNVTTPETHSGLDEETDETFRFIYSQEDQDNAEYLLKDLEEEVFNKVRRERERGESDMTSRSLQQQHTNY